MLSFSEKFLYHIWDGFHFVNPLITESGKKVEVLFQGRWNTSAGPDFLNAILKIDNTTITGDIEIHLDSYDWKKHSHDEDKNYNNVILHIVYTNNLHTDYTISENGKKIEIVNISNFLDQNILKLLSKYGNKSFIPEDKYCKFFQTGNDKHIFLILKELGLKRFENKIKRFEAELTFRSFKQVLYSALLESMGYSKNKFQMIELAQNIGIQKLKNLYKKGMNYNDFVAGVLISSDLISLLPNTFPIQFKKKWLDIYTKKKLFKETYNIDWNTFRIRPINNPAIRFLQISKLIFNGLKSTFEDYFFSVFSIPENKLNIKNFRENLYDFFLAGNEYLPIKYRIGKSRIDTIAINVLIPLANLYARKILSENLENATRFVFTEYPGLTKNFILDFMSKFTDSRQRRLINKKSVYQQGVLHLYFSYCNKHLCEICLLNKKEISKNLIKGGLYAV